MLNINFIIIDSIIVIVKKVLFNSIEGFLITLGFLITNTLFFIVEVSKRNIRLIIINIKLIT